MREQEQHPEQAVRSESSERAPRADHPGVAIGQSAELLTPIMRRGAGAVGGDPAAHYQAATSGAGQAVPFQAEMEAGFGGADFGSVRAHLGQASELAAIGAEAATAGDGQIAFADAQPSKETVAHELAHVQQARNAGGGAIQARGPVSSPSDPAEREADAAAAVVASGGVVDGGSLTARGTGIMRKDVEVTAGDRKETEKTTRVQDQGNQFEGNTNAWDCMVAWKEGTSIAYSIGPNKNFTQVPTNAHAAKFFYQMTPDQRTKIWMNEKGVLRHAFSQFDAAQVQRMIDFCDFPLQWKIIHWSEDVTGGAITRDVLRGMISAAPLGQRLVVVQDAKCVAHLKVPLKDDHPENIFGDEVKANLYPDEFTAMFFDAFNAEYAEWRNSAVKLDAEGRWALIAADPAGAVATLKSQPAMGGLNKWTSLIKWGPRGVALSPTMRANIDKAALDAGTATDDRAMMFEMRWNCPLVDPGIALDRFKPLYGALQAMPLGIVTSDVVTKITIDNSKSGGAYNDYIDSAKFGSFWVGTGPSASLAKIASTTRHEIGHAADVKLGGFTNLASKPPILWKKWMDTDAWVAEMVKYMDPPSAPDESSALNGLMKAAVGNSAWASPFGAYTGPTTGTLSPENQKKKTWHDAATAYSSNANSISKALDVLRPANKTTAANAPMNDIVTNARLKSGGGSHPESEPNYLRDRFFLKKYGEHFMYHKKGGSEVWSNGNLRAYTLCSPYEFYADIFSAYFSTDTDREKNIPAWTRDYMKSLEAMYETSAMDDPSNTRAQAYGNFQAPGAEKS